MDRRTYQWHIKYSEEEIMRAVTELKKIVNGINSASDAREAIYSIQVKYENLYRHCIVCNYLLGIEYDFPKKEGDENGDS